MGKDENNFARGSIPRHIINLAGPMIVAQLINVLYNVIDRIYIGRIPDVATLAMGGLGLCLPLISIIIAFANLFGMGGAPLCSIARGRGDIEEAEEIMGNSFMLLIIFGIVLTVIGLIFKEDLLWLFGASEHTIGYANDYMTIYLLGTVFVLIGLGMNSFINSQGFAKIGMMTVLLGAIVNIILDPIFIFGLDLGVKGAAFATVISQFISALWTLRFLTGKKTILKIKKQYLSLKVKYVTKIISLGMAGFMMAITNSIVTIVCNATLQQYGGDLYIAIMTIINSIREVASLPGYEVIVTKLLTAAVPKANVLKKPEGLLKAIIDKKTERILGCVLLCEHSEELINLVTLVMNNDLSYKVLKNQIFTHPTMAEALNDLFDL